MSTKAQEWFLVKKNWEDWLLTLTDEQAGQVFKSLYTGDLPEGLIGVLVKSHMEEFIRVNEKREEGLAKRRQASKKGNEIKYQTTPSGNPNDSLSTPTLSRTNTNTITNTDIQDKDKDSIIEDRVLEWDKLMNE
jgi:hypothetical protein